MAEDTSTYQPKYTNLEDIPLSGPKSADYSQEAKLRAIRVAESKLEAKVNGGNPIQNPEHVHWTASSALASYVLVAGTEEPSGQHLGDFADDGGGQSSYTDRMWNLWQTTIEEILDAPGDESSRLNHFIQTVN